MPPVNFNKLLANSNSNENINNLLAALNKKASASSANSNSNNNFLRNVEKSSNYYIQSTFHHDDGLKNKNIKVTKPSLIMFNAIVNDGFQRSNRKLELGMMAENIVKTKLPFKKHVFENNGISIQVRKITGRYGRLQPAFTITNTYSHTGRNIFNDRVFCLEFLISLTLSTEVVNATMSIFNNGKIKISGGYLNQNDDNMNNEEFFEAQPELIREFIVDNYTNKEKFLRNDFKFNNVVSEVRFNKGFNLTTISQFAINSKEYDIRFNPEISPNMFIHFGNFDYVVSQKGIVKIQGIKEYDDIQESYEFILDFVNAMTDFEKSQKPDKNGRIRRALLNINVSNRIKKQAKFDPNMPAPNVTRRGTSCPKSRCPVPYSIQGKCPKEGYYVKPNPQGQPCCYKIPKKTNYSEKKVMAAFALANVKVPNMVRKVFNFGTNTNNKRNNTSHSKTENIMVKMNSKVGLKIGSRQCMRYSKVALVDIAHRLGLPVTPSMDRPKICALIQSVAKNVTNTNNVRGALAVKFTNANKVFVVTGNSLNTLKVGGRIAKTIKRDKLFRYAVKLGARPGEFATIADICKMIFERYTALKPKPKNKSPSPSPPPQPRKKAKATPNAMNQLKKLRLTKNLIEEDVRKFLGPQWIEKKGVSNNSISKKASELYEALGNAINTNRLGLASKNIKEFKKVLLRKWKEDTEIEVIRAKYASLPYYPNVIQAVQNYAIRRNAEGKFPKHANVLKYANVRSKVARQNNFFPIKPLGKKATGPNQEEL
jgi:hypothetical protein